jgi:hypothetical protein
MAYPFQNLIQKSARFLQNTLPDDVQTANDRYDIFDSLDSQRLEKTNNLAVSIKNYGPSRGSEPQTAIRKDHSYYQFVYGQLEQNKSGRVMEYRQLAKNPKIGACVDEYKQACINRQKDEDLVSLEIKGTEVNETQKGEIAKEWDKFIDMFKLKEKGRGIMDDLLVFGEVYWENVISKTKPELGILDVKRIPVENIDPYYSNVANDDIDHFLLRKKTEKPGDPMSSFDTNLNAGQFTPLHRYQVTYAHSGEWDATHKYRVPFIDKARQSQKRLTLIEDSIVVNAMTNAPDRLLFNVATSNMTDAQGRQYMEKFVQDFYRKKGYDADGNIVDQFNPLSITEAIFVQKGRGADPTTVERLAGSQAFGNNFSEMLQYFHNAVYEDMHVPVSRLNPESQASDGTVATFQEIAFGERVKDLQIQLSEALKKSFIIHLKLKGIKLHEEGVRKIITESVAERVGKTDTLLNVPDKILLEQHFRMVAGGTYKEMLKHMPNDEEVKDSYTSLWDNYNLEESMIEVDLSLPSITLALREQQYFELKVNQFNQLAANENFSIYYLAKKYLGWTDNEIRINREWKRVEAEEFWETNNIMEGGPDFRENLAAELEGALGGGGGGSIGDTGSALGDMGDLTGDEPEPETGEGGSQDEAPLPDFGAGDAGGETPPAEGEEGEEA